jgi:cysteine-rich repeat protein
MMVNTFSIASSIATVLLVLQLVPNPAVAQTINGFIATTTVDTAICGNSVVDASEDCDSPGETGDYSTTIAGRQCDVDCEFGPYCGDGILQTTYDEECDDGNNDNGDFCSATCTLEPAGSGGGGSGGGGSGRGGGSSEPLGDTQISVTGQTIPRADVTILLNAEEVGEVRADANGRFEFATEASPGTASMGFWTEDDDGNRSITINTTFDVTQGAITDVNGVLIPPTLVVDDQTVDPGDVVRFSGQTIPNAIVDLYRDQSTVVGTVTSDNSGRWEFTYDTAGVSPADYSFRAKVTVGSGSLNTESGFSSTLQLFVGVDGQPTTPSDLNRDGSVNLTDFSILIFWWNTNGGDSDPPADINGNGNVGIEDFSILLFNWTG